MALGRPVLLATALAVLGAALTTVPVRADAPLVAEPDPAASTEVAEPLALGLVITPERARPSAATVERAEDLLATDVTAQRAAAGAYVLRTDEVVDARTAQRAARVLAARSDVASAQPNYLLRPSEASPAPSNDPLRSRQRTLWDVARPGGGHGTRAPAFWQRSGRGAGVVVAVLDSGITAHPDLGANLVPGYDMISATRDPRVPGGIARDGDGRDPDPSDPGDWTTARTSRHCTGRSDARAEPSSWHGTHVAGIVGAVTGNGIGVAGQAPDVSVQPVRVLGQCGGSMSDIADGIRWAAGGSVPGVPANPTPARVVNLSLGGAGRCPSFLQAAIDDARRRGAVVVVAAGNEGGDAGSSTPANCAGVVAVAASTSTGRMATFSNRGAVVDLTAPGAEVLSTWNTGTTTPGRATYAAGSGTSQAAPAVSAAAALLRSAAPGTSVAALEASLRRAVRPFAVTTRGGGSGILDSSRLFVARAAPQQSGRAARGAVLRGTPGSWTLGRAVVRGWFRDGRLVSRATTYRLGRADAGRRLTYGEVPGLGSWRGNTLHSRAVVLPR